MKVLYYFYFCVATALHFSMNIFSNLTNGLEPLFVIFTGLFNFICSFYIQSIGSGKGIFEGLFLILILLTILVSLFIKYYWDIGNRGYYFNWYRDFFSYFNNFIFYLSAHKNFLGGVYRFLYKKIIFGFVFSVIGGLILYLFDINIFNQIHCDSDDEDDDEDEGNSNDLLNNDNKNIDKGKGVLNITENRNDDGKESYTITVDKESFLKGVSVAAKVVTDALPGVGIGMAAGSVAKGVMNSTGGTPGVKAALGVGSAIAVGVGLYGGKELIDNQFNNKGASNEIKEMIRTRAGGVDNLVCSNSTQLPEVKLPVGGSNSFVRSASNVDGSI